MGVGINGAAHHPSGAANRLQELVEITEQTDLCEGDIWCIVPQTWWKQLGSFLKAPSTFTLPRMDFSAILDGRDVKSGLTEGMDFTIVPLDVFNELATTFGLADASHDRLERRVIAKPNGEKMVEIWPKLITVVTAQDSTRKATISVPPNATIGSIRSSVMEAFAITGKSPRDVNLYLKLEGGSRLEIIPSDKEYTSFDNYYSRDLVVVLDVADETGAFFIKPQHRNPYAAAASSNTRSAMAPGVCGLTNLGNTCFMNSALQCLLHVADLKDYFLSGHFKKDLNESNPLGTGGELARAYADLVEAVWSGRVPSITPRPFKMVIGQFAPRFSGYAQQDAQELLAFVLDGLHEDLNRIVKKPYVEEDPNNEHLPEQQKASIAWEAYKSRNDSAIVDLFHGQLKSTLTCPECEKVSIKFDPFCFLSVPLPPKDKPVQQMCTLIFNPVRRWAKFAVVVARKTLVGELISIMKEGVSDGTNMHLVVAVVESNRLVQVLDENEPVLDADGRQRELFAMQVAQPRNRAPLLVTRQVLANSTRQDRDIALPLLFSLNDWSGHVTEDFVDNHVLRMIRETFVMSDDQLKRQITDEKTVNEYIRANLDSVQLERGGHLVALDQSDAKTPPSPGGHPTRLVITWKSDKIFNKYHGQDLVERETTAEMVKHVTLSACVENFTKEERLSEHDLWYCPHCKVHQRATKKLDLWRLPEILVVHLKRFTYTRWSRDKIDIAVAIPVRHFELSQHVVNDQHEQAVYELIAVSEHMGGLGGGHYTAIARVGEDWFSFNDSSTARCETPGDPLTARSPYLLVYRRRRPTHQDDNLDMET